MLAVELRKCSLKCRGSPQVSPTKCPRGIPSSRVLLLRCPPQSIPGVFPQAGYCFYSIPLKVSQGYPLKQGIASKVFPSKHPRGIPSSTPQSVPGVVPQEFPQSISGVFLQVGCSLSGIPSKYPRGIPSSTPQSISGVFPQVGFALEYPSQNRGSPEALLSLTGEAGSAGVELLNGFQRKRQSKRRCHFEVQL